MIQFDLNEAEHLYWAIQQYIKNAGGVDPVTYQETGMRDKQISVHDRLADFVDADRWEDV